MASSPRFASNTAGRRPVQWVKALLILFLGLTIAHLGVTLFLITDLGTDTFTILIQGLARTAGVSVGTMHVIVLCLLMTVMLVFTRGYVKPGTVVCAFCGGPIIDFFTWLLGGLVSGASPLPVRLLVMAFGCIVLACGMSVVIGSHAGTGPNDLIAIIISDKWGRWEFRWVRMACDGLFVLLGFLLGRTLGIGTVAAALLTGPCVQFFLPRTGRLIGRCHIDPDKAS